MKTRILIKAIQELSLTRDLETVLSIVKTAARAIAGADGASLILREDGNCFYADEDAIEPLWKGRRFPLTSCASGWVMLNRQPLAISDIFSDDRIPADLYRPTFVKSLLIVPIRQQDPIGAVGAYWADNHIINEDELEWIQNLADSASIAIENINSLRLYNESLEKLEIQNRKILSQQTDLVKTHSTLEKSETLFRLVFENSPVGKSITGLDGKIHANRAFCEMLGYAPDELNGQNFDHITHPDDRNLSNDLIDHMRSNPDQAIRIEKRYLHKNGSVVIADVRSVLQCDEAGNPLYFITNAVDITDRIRDEKALKQALNRAEENERSLNEAQDVGNLGSYAWDMQTNRWSSSPTLDRLFGIDERYDRSLEGWGMLIHPDDRTDMMLYVANEVIGRRVPFDREYRIVRQDDGRSRWVHGRGRLETDDAGQPIRLIGTIHDITGRKEDEISLQAKNEEIATQYEELQQLNEELQQLNEELNTTNEELFSTLQVTLENKKILLENQREIELSNERLESLLRISQFRTNSIQELLDFALKEAISLTQSKIGYIYFYNESTRLFTLNTWSDEVMNECRVQDYQLVYQLEKTGCWGEVVRQRKPVVINNYAAENPLKKGIPSGHVQLTTFMSIPVIIDDHIVAVAGVANKPDGYNPKDVRQLTLLMDNVWKISERILLIANLKEAKEKAEESDRLKSAFLANMSHEIRTPLNGILGFTELLKEPDLEPDEKDRYLQIIEQSGERMLSTISDIVDIAKIESGQITVERTEIRLGDLLNDLYRFFEPEAHGKGLKLTCASCRNRNLVLHSDRDKLFAILTNLIKNAIKYTVKGTVEFGFRQLDGSIEFYVSDTGIGIPADQHDAVFERFVRLNTHSVHSQSGTGLGLTIVQAYVDLLGGTIDLQSQVEKGTRFAFTLPA